MSLDPRSPFVLDTRDLGRRPGAMHQVERSIEAPDDLCTDLIGVPAGSTLNAQLRMESVMDGVLVSGQVTGAISGSCVRCLESIEDQLDVDIQELYLYPGRQVESDESEEDVLLLDGDYLDLEPAIRDAVVLSLPFQPVCTDDCPGLCSQCGIALADDPEHHHDDIDARWQALQGLLTEGGAAGAAEETKES